MAGADYSQELACAMQAVRLASKLCQVHSWCLPWAFAQFSCWSSMNPTIGSIKTLTRHAGALQKVQLQLKAGEKTDKADDSPVTIADYGAAICASCSFLWPDDG